MNTQRFSDALSEIDGKYIWEALQYHGKRKTHRWVRLAAAAACLAAVCGVVLTALPQDTGMEPSLENPPGSMAESPDGAPPAASQIHLDGDGIFINEIESLGDCARFWQDPSQYDALFWDSGELAAYYGKDLTPAYIPQGLKAAPSNGTAEVWMQKDGSILWDTVNMAFYHDYYEDGSPKLTDDVAAVKGFSVAVSKMGLVDGCDYVAPENEIKTSLIGETAVTFGRQSMPYGPYDAQTHEPSGFYDLYTAEFEYGGIQYQITAEQLQLQELVKVTASIIFEGKEFVLDWD